MRSAVFVDKGLIEVQEVPNPVIEKPTDAVVRVVRACVCGSDLWPFRGLSNRTKGSTIGHEAIGVVEEIGTDVKDFKIGDFVIVPFTHGCGKCKICLAGFEANCVNEEKGLYPGYQAEHLRVINADGSLVKIPGKPSDYTEDQLKSLTTLSDVMPTGFHAAKAAGVKAGDIVVVMGDGAVGLCAVLSAQILGASKIIAMSRHEDRQILAKKFGATDIIPERDAEAVEKVLELTDGFGADAVLECVGTAQSVETAFQIARAGANIGRVGLPHDVDYNTYMDGLFRNNIGLVGGIASPNKYDKDLLLEKVLDNSINPGLVFTQSFELDEIQEAYLAMDERRAIKSLVKVSD